MGYRAVKTTIAGADLYRSSVLHDSPRVEKVSRNETAMAMASGGKWGVFIHSPQLTSGLGSVVILPSGENAFWSVIMLNEAKVSRPRLGPGI